MKLADAFALAREADRLVNGVQSSRVLPANKVGLPAVNREADSDQRRGHIRRSATRA